MKHVGLSWSDRHSRPVSLSREKEDNDTAPEVQTLQSGLAELDKSVAEAGENRKAEHQDFQDQGGRGWQAPLMKGP